MKRISAVFTAINILAVIAMLILVGYGYSHLGLGTPPYVAFLTGGIFISPPALINGIWLLIRLIRGEVPHSASNGTDSDYRRWLLPARLNAVFILLNILLAAAITIHGTVYTLRIGGSAALDFISIVFLYSVSVVLINDAWVVAYMNMKERLEEKGWKKR